MDILGMDVRKKMDKGKKNQVKELFHHDTPLKRLYIYARVRLFVTLIELCWTCQDSVMFRKRKRILIRGIINRKYVYPRSSSCKNTHGNSDIALFQLEFMADPSISFVTNTTYAREWPASSHSRINCTHEKATRHASRLTTIHAD